MNKKYPVFGIAIVLITLLFINSCELNSSYTSDHDKLLGVWKATNFSVDGQERIDAIFSKIEMQFDQAGSAAWLFTGINDEQESVSGSFEVSSGNRSSVLKFIDPEFSVTISDTLYLTGISASNKEYNIKAIR
jgi:hypothetical protein